MTINCNGPLRCANKVCSILKQMKRNKKFYKVEENLDMVQSYGINSAQYNTTMDKLAQKCGNLKIM